MSKELFSQLHEWSRQKDSYSIKDFENHVGLPHKTIKTLSQENEHWRHDFEIVRCRLVCNAYRAKNAKSINFQAWLRYAYENDYFLRENLQQSEGIVIPEDSEELNQWVEKRIEIDKIKYGN